MPNGLLQIAQAAEDEQFRRRVKAAIFSIAQDIANEATDVPGHQYRAFLATQVIGNPDSMVAQFAWYCGSNPTVRDSVTISETGEIDVSAADGDISYVCAGAWNRVAGVPTEVS